MENVKKSGMAHPLPWQTLRESQRPTRWWRYTNVRGLVRGNEPGVDQPGWFGKRLPVRFIQSLLRLRRGSGRERWLMWEQLAERWHVWHVITVCVCVCVLRLRCQSSAVRPEERHQGDLLRSSLILRVSDSKLLREQTRPDANAEDRVSGGDSRGLCDAMGLKLIRPPVPRRDQRGDEGVCQQTPFVFARGCVVGARAFRPSCTLGLEELQSVCTGRQPGLRNFRRQNENLVSPHVQAETHAAPLLHVTDGFLQQFGPKGSWHSGTSLFFASRCRVP